VTHTRELTQPIEQLYRELGARIGEDSEFEEQVSLNLECAESLFAQRGDLLTLLDSASPSSEQTRAQLHSHLLQESRWLLQKRNQFTVLSEPDLIRLATLTNDWLKALHAALLAAKSAVECLELLRPHSIAHVQELTALLVCAARPDERIRCEEYSAETQLGVLRLQAATLVQPVVDIGCGRDADLVKWLRGKNVNAVGFDLFDSVGEGCLVADWFEFPFVPDQFGTIIAHLSFSLHFLHQHLRPDGDARRYALQYMAILRSLRRGGSFVYAPGLPFIEGLLPSDQYVVTRYAIDRLPLDERAMDVFAKYLRESPIYACHVERR
jgi:hypothetical protein